MIAGFRHASLILLLLAQIVAAVRVIARLARTASGARIAAGTAASSDSLDDFGSVTVLVPVLDEEHRLAPCLAGLSAQPPSVAEILVVDGGSTDRTRDVAAAAIADDPRIRWIDASPVPAGWNGKAWGLQRGFERRDRRTRWVLTIDADVRPGRGLVPSLLAHARRENLGAFSVATPQRVSGLIEGVVHPALLASLVYRYGIPGRAETDPEGVQANGQCFLARTEILEGIGGFEGGRHAISEDVTIARELTRRGVSVGFFEPEPGAGLVEVEMYASGRDAWTNWTRSLPMRDERSGWGWWLRMADLTLTLGLPPLVLLAGLIAIARKRRQQSVWRERFPRVVPDGHGGRWVPIRRHGTAPMPATGRPLQSLGAGFNAVTRKRRQQTPWRMCVRLNAGLVIMRIGVAAGMRRAYRNPPWTYWCSVLVDPLTVLKLWSSAVRRQHTWRGRPVRRGYNDEQDAGVS